MRWDNSAAFGGTDAGSGPFELRKNDDTVIGTFSGRQFCTARTTGSLWKSYPVGTPQYPIQEEPSGWAQASGSVINIPSDSQSISATIKLRLRSLSPATASGQGKWVRLKQDHVMLTITYAIDPRPASAFLSFF